MNNKSAVVPPAVRAALSRTDSKLDKLISSLERTNPGLRSRVSGEMTVYLLLDCSGSMAGSIEAARVGAVDFAIQAASDGYAVGAVQFSDSASALFEPTHDCDRVRSELRRLRSGGGTNMAEAIELATRLLSPKQGERAIVLVTDGEPNDRTSTLRAAREAAALDIHILAVAISGADMSFLRTLTTRENLVVPASREEIANGIRRASTLLLAHKR